jgi:hypothetical protein
VVGFLFFFWEDFTICLGWLWTIIFLISASWVARITGGSHWHPARLGFKWKGMCCLCDGLSDKYMLQNQL